MIKNTEFQSRNSSSQVCNAVPMFKDLHQQDSLELLCVLLDSIRTEEIGESNLVSLRQPLSFCVIYLPSLDSGMSQSCQLKRIPNFIDDVFGGLTRSVVVCSRCCRPSVALERCMHTSVCFPAQLVDSLRPQRSNKSKNKTKAQNNKQGGKGKKGGKNNGKRNQAESDDECAAPEEPAGHASPETSPPPSGGKKKQFKNYKQQQREFARLKKSNKGKGGFSNFEMLDEEAEEERRQAALELQKKKEDIDMNELSQALSATNRDGAGSDDAASRGSVADVDALDGDDEAPAFGFDDLFEESEEDKAVRCIWLRVAHKVVFLLL